MSKAVSQSADSEPYRLDVVNVGGREPDGSPSYIGPWTFDTKLVRDEVIGAIEGPTLNACAGKTRLDEEHSAPVVRNDLNPDRHAHVNVDVATIDEVFPKESFRSVVFDPPFDQTQSEDHYEGMHDRQRGPSRRKLAGLVEPGGVFVECGWNMFSPGEFDGWEREAVIVYRRGPSYQPMFLTVDRRTSRQANFSEVL